MSTAEQDQFPRTGLQNSLIKPAESEPLSRPSACDRVAVEIMEEIFRLSLPVVELPPATIPLQYRKKKYKIVAPLPFHFVLALVCKRWLGIATAHHSLWATFALDPDVKWRLVFCTHLSRYLKKSGTHPLTIQVRAGFGDEDISDILDVIMRHSERWRSVEFKFCMGDHALQQLDFVRGRVPLLQELLISRRLANRPMKMRDFAAFYNAPSLTHITLENIHTPQLLNLPWAQISQMTLDGRSLESMRPIIASSQTLRIVNITEHHTAWLSEYVTLQNLQVLRVLSSGSASIGKLRCASLKLLEVHSEHRATVLTFLDNSSCALTSLELGKSSIHKPDSDPPAAAQILQHPSLASLTSLHLVNHDLSEAVLDILILDYRMQLPVLETLAVDLVFEYKEQGFFQSQIGGLQKIVQSRTRTALQVDESSPEDLLDSPLQNGIRAVLKECLCDFTVNVATWTTWQDEELEHFRVLCISRGVAVRVHKRAVEFYLHVNPLIYY